MMIYVWQPAVLEDYLRLKVSIFNVGNIKMPTLIDAQCLKKRYANWGCGWKALAVVMTRMSAQAGERPRLWRPRLARPPEGPPPRKDQTFSETLL